MSTILMAGVGPLPVQAARRLYAPGLRTWSFARALADRGHAVLCATAEFGGIEEEAPVAAELAVGAGSVRFARLPFEPARIARELRRLVEELAPACAVATTDLMNRALAQAHPPVPVWLDFNGHPLAERQLQAEVHGDDGGLLAQWDFVLPALMFGDRFSACSTAQKHALIGELGAAGRLNRRTAGRVLADAMPAIYPRRNLQPPPGPNVIRGLLCDDDAFVLLWTGGYNTWADVDVLFAGLEAAMTRHPRLTYVSTGGAIAGHDELTFPRFKALVDASPHRARYHFAGWVDNELVPAYYHEADAAINLDRPSYEAELGFRTRVMEWIAAGLPVLTTAISEITRELAAAELVWPFAGDDPEALAGAIGELIENPAAARARAAKAREHLRRRYDSTRVLAPLLEWCGDPRPAPDLPSPADRPRLRWAGPDNALARLYQKHMKKAKLL